jgi:hypothetical protein
VKGGSEGMRSTFRCPSSGVAVIYFWGRVPEGEGGRAADGQHTQVSLLRRSSDLLLGKGA